MTISSLLFWVLVIAGIVALVRYAGRRTQAGVLPGDRPTPQRVLAERFARGEIDGDEYTRRLQVLDGTASIRRPVGAVDAGVGYGL